MYPVTTVLIFVLVCTILIASNVRSQTWTQRGQDIDGEAAGDLSGWSISLSSDGTALAIGAQGNDGAGSSAAGHVRVHTWNSTSWVQRGQDINGEAALDSSGGSVSLSSKGTVVAIGAPGNDATGSNAGHVRVYAWNGTSWIKRGQDIDGEASGDFSGSSVSLSADGNAVAIGATSNDVAGTSAGHVRVYTWNGTSWIKRGQDIDGVAAFNQFGYSVSLSSDGTVVAIGANGYGNYKGRVQVYTWSGTLWTELGQAIDGEAANDHFGSAVSLSSDGSVVAIGASSADRVRVYIWNGTSWIQRGQDMDGETVFLSSDGSVVAIGAPFNGGASTFSGRGRVFAWDGTLWIQQGQDIDGETESDQSGNCVSLSSDGTIVAIGASNNDGASGSTNDNRGSVRVYTYPLPSHEPTIVPSVAPSSEPTIVPSAAPSDEPTIVPSAAPSDEPTIVPSAAPSDEPTIVPSAAPSDEPTIVPSSEPSFLPTRFPSASSVPSHAPSRLPTFYPTRQPSYRPTRSPTKAPVHKPKPKPKDFQSQETGESNESV